MAKKDTEFQDSAQDRDDLARVYHAIMARNPEHDFEPTLDRVTQVLDLLGIRNTLSARFTSRARTERRRPRAWWSLWSLNMGCGPAGSLHLI